MTQPDDEGAARGGVTSHLTGQPGDQHEQPLTPTVLPDAGRSMVSGQSLDVGLFQASVTGLRALKCSCCLRYDSVKKIAVPTTPGDVLACRYHRSLIED